MMKPLLKCALLGGLVVYIWYMFSWMILPWHDMTMNRFTNQNAVSEAIMNNAPVNGVYVLPSMKPPLVDTTPENNPPAGENWNGPFVYANVVREGISANSMIRPMIIALVVQFIGAFLVTWLLLHAKAMRYWPRVRFVTVVGFIIGFLSMTPLWNWWGFTAGYAIVGIIDTTIAWFIGGLVIGRLVKH